MSRKRLVTIPFSHYCEKARWALDRAGTTYDEEKHLPILQAIPVRLAGGTRQVPILVTPHGVIEDSTRILEWVDATLPEPQRLFPHDPALRAEVSRWESRFDDELGPHTRRWGYSYMLLERDRVVDILGRHVPAWEIRAFALTFPVVAELIRRGLKITPDGVERSLRKMHKVFDDVSAALSDGRRYLAGDRLTAADIAFATLSAPVLFPDGYAKWLCARDELPAGMLPTVDALRATPAGAYALRLYDHERGLRASAA